MLAASDYTTVAILLLVAIGLTIVTLLLAHLIGPRRHGPIKDTPYESGLAPFTDAHRRFNVRFYLVAVMYVVFGVEVLFLYPCAVLLPWLRQRLSEHQAAADVVSETPEALWAGAMADLGYGPAFILGAILIFFVLLLVGFAYEWRRGIFKWD